MDNSCGLLGNPDELKLLNMINSGGIMGFLQSLRNTQITGGGNFGAGERVLSGTATIPLSEEWRAYVGGHSIKAQGFNENKITDVGLNYKPVEGTDFGLNIYRRPNEYGPDQGVWVTLNKQFP